MIVNSTTIFVVVHIPYNRAKLSSINGITIIVKPTPSYPSNDCICKGNSHLLLLWLIIGVVFFANIITVIVVKISCLCLIRRKYEKCINLKMVFHVH